MCDALTRRIRALPTDAMTTKTWGRRSNNDPPPALGVPPPRAATCLKAPPSPATNPIRAPSLPLLDTAVPLSSGVRGSRQPINCRVSRCAAKNMIHVA